MDEHFAPCTTVVGFIHGRDAFFLDDVHHEPKHLHLTFRGELTSSLCSIPPSTDDFVPYQLSFFEVLAFKMEEIDFSSRRNRSSFAEIKQSQWRKQLQMSDATKRLSAMHKHFSLVTYDHIFDIIAKSYDLIITNIDNYKYEQE